MKKNKRFVNIENEIHLNDKWWCSAKGEHCADVITTALNELYEENEQLKMIIATLQNMEMENADLGQENKKLKHHIKKLEKELYLAHMRAMFSTIKSFNGDINKRYYYSEETDKVYDTANHYGQYDKILEKKEIVMLLNEYETMLNGDNKND